MEGHWGRKGGPWELNLRDVFRWCDLLIKYQVYFCKFSFCDLIIDTKWVMLLATLRPTYKLLASLELWHLEPWSVCASYLL